MGHRRTQNVIIVSGPGLKSSNLLKELKSDARYRIVETTTPEEVGARVAAEKGDLVLIAADQAAEFLPDLVIKVRGSDPSLPILLVLSDGIDKRARDSLWKTGIDDCINLRGTPGELSHRVARLIKTRNLNRRYEELRHENRQLWELAVTDGLTRLINRRHLGERLKTEFARIKRFGGGLGCAIADIDHFKKINDSYGHLVGDRILRQLADLFRGSVRSIDTVARYGGEEFVFLMPETTGQGLFFAAEKLRKIVEENDFRDPTGPDEPGPERITISLGVAAYPDNPVDRPEKLLELADAALYRAKEGGRDRVEVA